MKKLFSLMLLCTAMMFSFSACSDDDDDAKKIELTQEKIVGTWDITWAKEEGKELDIPTGSISAQFNENYTYKIVMFKDSYKGTYKIEGNTVIGTTLDPIDEYFTFKKLIGNDAEIDYRNSEKLKMQFKARRTKK